MPSRTVAGDVVCLIAGSYGLTSPLYIWRSGAPGAYVVYHSYGGRATIKWAGGTDTMIGVTSGTSYIILRGLTIDAANRANQDINCNTAHHVLVTGNRLLNGGAAGFSSYRCDYVTVRGNLIHHAGYAAGWSSGISLNTSIWSNSSPVFTASSRTTSSRVATTTRVTTVTATASSSIAAGTSHPC